MLGAQTTRLYIRYIKVEACSSHASLLDLRPTIEACGSHASTWKFQTRKVRWASLTRYNHRFNLFNRVDLIGEGEVIEAEGADLLGAVIPAPCDDFYTDVGTFDRIGQFFRVGIEFFGMFGIEVE